MKSTSIQLAGAKALAGTASACLRTKARYGMAAKLLVSTALGAGLIVPLAAAAQTIPPARQVIDSRGVDVLAGKPIVGTTAITMADMGFSESWTGDFGHSAFEGRVNGNALWARVTLGGVTKQFNPDGSGGWVSADADGSTLVYSTVTTAYTYTTADGTVYEFTNLENSTNPYGRRYLENIIRPDGTRIRYDYQVTELSPCGRPKCPIAVRLQTVTSSKGFMIKPEYAGSTPGGSGYSTVNSVKLIDLSVDYCAPGASTCSGLTQSWPTLTESRNVSGSTTTTTITDEESNTTTVVNNTNGVTGVDEPAAPGNDVAITYDGSGRVATRTEHGVTYSYNYSTSGSTQTTTVTAPDSSTEIYAVDTATSRLTSVTNQAGQTTSYQHDSAGRVTRETLPEGDYLQTTYDGRGNITEMRRVAKSGSGLADLVTTWNFDATCSNTLTCNKPNYVIDPRGNRTDYTYDATHGGVTRVQLPSPDGVQPRPETNYAYTALYAQQKNSAGTLVPVSTPVYKVTQVTSCATAATCSGTANETKITLAYNTPNLSLTSKTVAAGDGSVSATETYAYNFREQLVSVDGPLPGSDDTTYIIPGIKQRIRGVISPDPDGGGSLPRRAVRYTHDQQDRVTRMELGTVTGTDLTALLAMTVFEQVDYTYNADGLLTKRTINSGGTTYSVHQMSYDGKGQLECTALRMNPAIFSSLPTSACSLSTAGSHGPDRIVRTVYDTAGRVTKVTSGYGTADQADDQNVTYTANGRVATALDAENNKTTYEYDGHDRLLKMRFPSSSQGAGTSSTTDYEQFTYDANGNVITRRLRDGNAIGFTYDALNRMASKDTPNLHSLEWDVTYQYDLFGRLVTATGNGWAVNARAYDALGRMTTQQNYNDTVYHKFDQAGRLTRLTWSDGLYVDYEYDPTGNMTAIRENGATSGVGVLATYAYDGLGRRSSITRGNGGVTSYNYDAVSRLSSLTHDLPGSGQDVTTTFAYNPAGRVASRTGNNDAYAYPAYANAVQSYATNGLNQHTTAAGASLGYDARGNVGTWGSASYGYTSENRLATTSGGLTLGYEPSGGQLLIATDSNGDNRFSWSGDRMVSEINASNWSIARRYVPGPGVDEPVVWYEGSGTSDRRWLVADERGSIVAVSDGSGTNSVNRYDEYGIPASGNVGRFQYTGQAWFPQLGMYYYKARVYSPSLGRFLQPDPIGYGDGMNLYNYVGGDPVNATDPQGLCVQVTGSRICHSTPAGLSAAYAGIGVTVSNEHAAAILKSGKVAALGGSVGQVTIRSAWFEKTKMQQLEPWQYTTIDLTSPAAYGLYGAMQTHGPHGPAYGLERGFNNYRGILSDRPGGFNDAWADIDQLAVWNDIAPLAGHSPKTGMPKGWVQVDMPGDGSSFRVRHLPTGLQFRLTGGRPHIDIPIGFRVGPGLMDRSMHGEVVHYGRKP